MVLMMSGVWLVDDGNAIDISSKWFADTYATMHMCFNRSWFSSIQKLDEADCIHSASRGAGVIAK